jgi:hypothetical protein
MELWHKSTVRNQGLLLLEELEYKMTTMIQLRPSVAFFPFRFLSFSGQALLMGFQAGQRKEDTRNSRPSYKAP